MSHLRLLVRLLAEVILYNGQASTSSKWALHSNNTNAGKTADDGIWFGDDGHGNMAKVNDNKGALPYDTYILDELPCKANEGCELITGVEFRISSDVEVSPERGYVNLGTITNDLKPPTLGTTATDSETKGHVSCADSDVTIIDKVDMKNLIVGRAYTVKGTLIDKETGKAVTVGGKAVTSEKPFVALAQNMTIDMEFNFDGTDMKGKDVVVYEHLYQYGIEIAEHADINDIGQTITFPEIGTTAIDSETGSHIANADKEVTIIDTVKFDKLTAGKEYTVTGTLMDKSTGKELLVDGKPVTETKTFTPDSENGSIDIEFTFDGSALKGKTVVVFEKVQTDGIDIAIHTDIEDEGQSVKFPEVGTTAAKVDKAIVDTVKYENLIVGQTYKVSGILMDKETGEPLLIDGQEVIAEAEFTAEKESGQLDVRFDVDETKLEGKTIVVFEELTLNGNVIGEHKDIDDANQTLEYPVPEQPTPEKPTPTPEKPAPKQPAPKTPAKEAGPQTSDASNIVMWIQIAGATLVIVGRVVSAKKNIKDRDTDEE